MNPQKRFRYGKVFMFISVTFVLLFLIFSENRVANNGHYTYEFALRELNRTLITYKENNIFLDDFGNTNEEITRKEKLIILNASSKHPAIEEERFDFDCKERDAKLSNKPLPLTGLVSFPGSGNTWVRHLLQQLTGIATSSVFCDQNLEKLGFKYECTKHRRHTIVVKTHLPGDIRKFDKVILLVRNPYETILSLMNFLVAGHTGVASEKDITEVYRYLPRHERVYRDLIQRTAAIVDRPVYILQYESLLENMTSELRSLADFLNAEVSDKDVYCTETLQEGLFHRNTSYRDRLESLQNIFTPGVMATMVPTVKHCEKILEQRFHKKYILGGHIQNVLTELNIKESNKKH